MLEYFPIGKYSRRKYPPSVRQTNKKIIIKRVKLFPAQYRNKEIIAFSNATQTMSAMEKSIFDKH